MTTRFTGSRRPLPLFQQLLGLQHLLPGSHGSVRSNRLIWRGDIRPTARSTMYTVQIVLQLSKPLEITILNPPLRRREGQLLPHVYSGDRLCVYMGDQWAPSKLLSATVLPWIVDWLFYYELWLATGEWLGGGHEPALRPKRRDAAVASQAGKRR